METVFKDEVAEVGDKGIQAHSWFVRAATVVPLVWKNQEYPIFSIISM